MKPPVLVPKGFRVIAHRGASAYAPENTLPAFWLAARMGVREVEIDVRLTRDGGVVLCHDAELTRYGYPHLRVCDLATEDFLSLDMGSWFSPYLFSGEPPLLLDTLFRIFGSRFTYHIELKDKSIKLLRSILQIVKEHSLAEHCIITSKYYEVLRAHVELETGARAGWIIDALTEGEIRKAAQSRFFQICPRVNKISPELVSIAHSFGLEVRVHHVNGLRDIDRAVDAGCDGATVDWPDRLVEAGSLAEEKDLQ